MSSARFAIAFTIVAWCAYLVDQVYRVVSSPVTVRVVIDTFTYFTVVTLLTASALAYLLTRLGYLYRTRDHHRVPRATIDDYFSSAMPTLTAIIPSYREESRVVRQTLLSAALQEYPLMRIVLLIDDPPNPTDAANRALLESSRALPGQIQDLLAPPRARFEAALAAFEAEGHHDADTQVRQLADLADLYDDAARWFRHQADAEQLVDHTDVFLADAVLGRLGTEMGEVATALRRAGAAGTQLSRVRMLQLHRRLAWTFRAELSSFERKQYASLSSEPNKAMNLNSYIGLMGRRFRVEDMPSGPVLFEVRGESGNFEVPDPDYVLTLDADSTLLPEYCLRLVYLMEQPESADIAVAQTPYSAYPGAPTRIERISGATTDLQHIVHQGLTRDNATYWVGANAVLRKRALDDICEIDDEDGLPIRRYIQDRTPIEDTESSIDISLRGWRLYNFPERLSYSATPPDFGSLCVQRQRWANGGLLVIPKFRQLFRMRRAQNGWRALREGFLRLNYLASIAWASFGLIVLLVYPYDDRMISPLALLAAVPYFVALSTDLHRTGYRRSDVFRVYGFNLLLLPVNTAGVAKSIEQSIGGQKIAFARTPKVRNRTVVPLSFVVVPYLIVIISTYTLWRDLQAGHVNHAVFAGSNAVLTMYAIVAFVGLRFSLTDIWVNIVERLYKPVPVATTAPEADWVSVLYYGSAETTRSSSVGPRVAALALVDQKPASLDDLVDDPRAAVFPTAAPDASVTVLEPRPATRPAPFADASTSGSPGVAVETATETPSSAGSGRRDRRRWWRRPGATRARRRATVAPVTGPSGTTASGPAGPALLEALGRYVADSGAALAVRVDETGVSISVDLADGPAVELAAAPVAEALRLAAPSPATEPEAADDDDQVLDPRFGAIVTGDLPRPGSVAVAAVGF